MLKFKNSLTGNIEEFAPIKKDHVRMYNCGPTVYDYVHIGNLRSFILADLLRRVFLFDNYTVTQVMNITDVGIGGDNDEGEDKIIKGLKREGKEISLESMKELTSFYTEAFQNDLKKLNILTPEFFPKASEHISENIDLISILEQKGFAYKTSDGVYFDTSKDEDYGKLGGIGREDDVARVEENSEKRNRRDFALWKKNHSIGYPSPWGQGFPGWHIECSAMSRKYLGDHFDVHTGGIDLAPIHHNNEIAQSESACDCTFVNFWIHNAFVNVENGKMAKSEGNTLTLNALIEKGFSPLAYRYWLLQAKYNTPVSFSFESLEAAQIAYEKLLRQFHSLGEDIGSVDNKYKNEFTECIDDDLNTPKALALAWDVLKDEDLKPQDKKATLLEFDKVFGLSFDVSDFLDDLREIPIEELPENIQILVKDRALAREEKDWERSDEIRLTLKKEGYEITDSAGGQKISAI